MKTSKRIEVNKSLNYDSLSIINESFTQAFDLHNHKNQENLIKLKLGFQDTEFCILNEF